MVAYGYPSAWNIGEEQRRHLAGAERRKDYDRIPPPAPGSAVSYDSRPSAYRWSPLVRMITDECLVTLAPARCCARSARPGHRCHPASGLSGFRAQRLGLAERRFGEFDPPRCTRRHGRSPGASRSETSRSGGPENSVFRRMMPPPPGLRRNWRSRTSGGCAPGSPPRRPFDAHRQQPVGDGVRGLVKFSKRHRNPRRR